MFMPRQTSFRLAIAFLAVAAVLNCGCQTLCCWVPPWRRTVVSESRPVPVPTFSVFASPSFLAQPPQRVVILPSGQTPGSYEHHQRAIDELATKLRQVGVFELVVPRDQRLRSQPDNLLEGSFDEREIAALSQHYNADAVAIVRVNELRPVAPLRTSITMVIVDAQESVVTFAVDGVWDLADHGTHYDFLTYLKTHQVATGLASSTSGKQPPIELQSPTALFSFASAQISGAVGVEVR